MAQLGGEPIKVKLKVDLTRYDSRLTTGQIGYTIPNTKLSMWGSQDTFVAVRFDCGARLDILWNSLEIIDERELKRIIDSKQKRLEELKSATNIEYNLKTKTLSYEYIDSDGIPNSCGVNFKKEVENEKEYFSSLGKEIKITFN